MIDIRKIKISILTKIGVYTMKASCALEKVSLRMAYTVYREMKNDPRITPEMLAKLWDNDLGKLVKRFENGES